MPPQREVISLSQMSINAIAELLVKGLDQESLLNLKVYNGKLESKIATNHLPSHLKENDRPEYRVKRKDILKLKLNEIGPPYHRKRTVPQPMEDNLVSNQNGCEDTLEPEEFCVKELDLQIVNSEEIVNKLKQHENQNVGEYLLNLALILTSHGHCTLQEMLFSTILPPLNRLYMKCQSKEIRPLMRKIVPLFINSSLRVLDFGTFKMFTEEKMFSAIYANLSNVQQLEKLVFGRSCYWRADAILNLKTVVKGMPNLQVLHIHYICQPNMLLSLAESCLQLQELGVKGSKEITDKEVPCLGQFINLECLDISGTSVTGRGCRALVLGLPKLTWLNHCAFNCNSDTLIFESRSELFDYIRRNLNRQADLPSAVVSLPSIRRQETVVTTHTEGTSPDEDLPPPGEATPSKFSLNLKNFWLFNASSEEILLTQLCPKLEHLRLDFVLQDLPEEPEVDALSRLQHLRSLAFYAYDRCPVQLLTAVLDVTLLTKMHLHLGDSWFFVAPLVNVISAQCHALETLVMEGDYKGSFSLEESDARLDFSLPPGGLPQLRHVRLTGCVSEGRLRHLLTQAPQLRTIHLDGELENLSDDVIAEGVRQNAFSDLEELWFNVSSGVTFASVRRLLQSENGLLRIGRLCLMASASREGYHELLSFVRRRNLATELVWVTDQRELGLPSPAGRKDAP